MTRHGNLGHRGRPLRRADRQQAFADRTGHVRRSGARPARRPDAHRSGRSCRSPAPQSASGSDSASWLPYRSARHPTATTLRLPSAAASRVSIESFLAESMKPQVLTRTTSALSASVSCQPLGGQGAGQFFRVHLVAGTAQSHDRNVAGLRGGHIATGYPPRRVVKFCCNSCAGSCVVSDMTPQLARPCGRRRDRRSRGGGRRVGRHPADAVPTQSLSEVWLAGTASDLTRFAYLICGDRASGRRSGPRRAAGDAPPLR